MSVSTALGNAGAGHSIEFRGKKYTARLVVQRIKSEVERWVQSRARREACAMAELLSPEKAREAIAAHTNAILAGEYSFVSDRVQDAIKTPEGVLFFTALTFGIDEETALALLMEKGAEAVAVLELVKEESFSPNAPAPAGQ